MDRRRFIRSPQFRQTAGALLADFQPPADVDYSLIRVSRRAMATRFEIALPLGTPHAVAAAEGALDLIDLLEEQLTVYRETSGVSRLNAEAFDRASPVEPRLFELLQTAAGLTGETAGAFDIATGSLIKAWGFFRRDGQVPGPAELARARQSSGIRHVSLDPERRTVKFLRPGLELNLGAIGKGYALDRVVEYLQTEWGIRSALVHGGGSSAFALGTPPGRPRGWPISLQHPDDVSRSLSTVYLKNQGLGTSAATFQQFEYNRQKFGHLLDPRTGEPAHGVASATAVAATAAEADALSTAFFVIGANAVTHYCHFRPGTSAWILDDGEPPPGRPVGLRREQFSIPDPPTDFAI